MPLPLRIRAHRRARNVRMQDLADQLGVSIATIHRWEVGATEPSLTDLQHIADALQLSSLSELLPVPLPGHGGRGPSPVHVHESEFL